MTTDFAALLATGRPVLIDGGLSTQCEAMGHNIDGELWSAQLLQSNPRAIVDATRAYLDAGARIVATASYQASRQGLVNAGLAEDEANALILSSVDLARQACREYQSDNPGAERPLVAISIGPYGAVMHDGSEYTGDYDIGDEDLRVFHEQRLRLLDASDADLFACETIPSGREAALLAELLSDVSKPAWISFSCRDECHLADGTPIDAVAGYFREHPRVLALGVNCVPPEIVLPLIGELRRSAPGKSIVVYPNSGEVYRSEDNSWHGTSTPMQCEQAAAEWIAAGAQLVGGCCRIGPEQIAAMSQSVSNSG
ncbi:MAG: homocysteine S-methyltransferase [Woeseiaceae bacterium]|nr:homocysteine S-methyltransferase [Woeseiaceae bacterium]